MAITVPPPCLRHSPDQDGPATIEFAGFDVCPVASRGLVGADVVWFFSWSGQGYSPWLKFCDREALADFLQEPAFRCRVAEFRLRSQARQAVLPLMHAFVLFIARSVGTAGTLGPAATPDASSLTGHSLVNVSAIRAGGCVRAAGTPRTFGSTIDAASEVFSRVNVHSGG